MAIVNPSPRCSAFSAPLRWIIFNAEARRTQSNAEQGTTVAILGTPYLAGKSPLDLDYYI